MARDLAIVLSSGSVNSAVAAALAAQKFRLVLLHIETVQNPGSRARAAHDQQVAHFKPYREHSLVIPYMGLLAAGQNNPAASMADPRHPAPLGPQMLELLPLVAASARFAAHYVASAIYLGLRVGPGGDELAQATEYIQVWNELVQLPCNLAEMEINAPLLELEPWQVIDLGFAVSAPLDRTWSCLEESGEPCWSCRGCRARDAAFQQAAKPDPIRVVRRA